MATDSNNRTESFGLPGGASFLRSVPRPTTKISLVAGLAKPTQRRRNVTTTPKNSDGDQDAFLSTDERTGCNLVQENGPRLESTASHQTARVPHPNFAIVNPSKVSSMAREVLVVWLKLRKEYEEYTQGRGKEGKEDVSAVMKSVKSFFDASVLETLCEVCWGVDQSSVTDDFLLGKIYEITDSF
ncbi:hypothetical protein PC119_g20492 [Phytophthora cactorum]|nr:hypothetical protein PC113_g20707 [Phytophthora cactorum]KAG2984034.1 hypothetical protein PC119_g20492 [Phytophthora cactorum]